jgi:hypothetical protein
VRPNDLNNEQLATLLRVLGQTRPDELTCDEWLERVSGYAEATAAGLPPPPGSELVRHHLDLCPECLEEFEALVQSLRGG